MRRRILIGLLMVAVLAGGLWWNATRLNETERKLVGVWEVASQSRLDALVLSPDGRAYTVTPDGDKWAVHLVHSRFTVRWDASPELLTFIWPAEKRSGASLAEWQSYLMMLLNGGNRRGVQISSLTRNGLALGDSSKQTPYRRSTDPELLLLFDRLSAGESP